MAEPPPWCDSEPFHLPGWWIAKNLPKNSERVEPYLMRPDSPQYLEPLVSRTCAPEARPPPRRRTRPERGRYRRRRFRRRGRRQGTAEPPDAPRYITGKLRRLHRHAWNSDERRVTMRRSCDDRRSASGWPESPSRNSNGRRRHSACRRASSPRGGRATQRSQVR